MQDEYQMESLTEYDVVTVLEIICIYTYIYLFIYNNIG